MIPIGEALMLYGGIALAYTLLKGIRKIGKKAPKEPIARIFLYGPIKEYTSTSSPLGSKEEITPDSVEGLVSKALRENAKGIIFQIASPGGAVVPSKEIGDYIKSIDVPTVALVKGVAASGGYWIASSCDKIVANPLSRVGGIGVVLSHIEISELANRFGIRYDGLHTGQYKEMGSVFRPFNEDERSVLEQELRFTHEKFIEKVAKDRGLEIEHVRKLANGLAYHGEKALELGLVDVLGGIEEAIKIIKESESLTNPEVVNYMKRESFFSRASYSSRRLGSSFGEGLYESIINHRPEIR